ncbi:MAG: PAS domain S-box protein, partial [Nitrospirae bacterium]
EAAVARLAQAAEAARAGAGGRLQGELEALVSQVAAASGRVARWAERYRPVARRVASRARVDRLRERLRAMRAAVDREVGRRRIHEAVRLRAWRRAQGAERRRLAERLVAARAGGRGSPYAEVERELSDLAALVERLAGETRRDDLADLKDNRLKPCLTRLRRDLERLGRKEGPLAPAAVDGLMEELFGRGYRVDRAHQRIEVGEGGLYRLRQDYLSLLEEREALLTLLPPLRARLAAVRVGLAEAVRQRAETLTEATEGRLQLLLFACGAGILLLLALTGRLARGVRRQVEALAELRRRNALLLESAAEGIYGLDAAGTITFANPAAGAMLGWPAAALVGRPHDTILPAPEGRRPPAARVQGEANYRRRDGSRFPAEYAIAPIEEGGAVQGAVAVFRDVSERKEQERRLLETTEELARANEALAAARDEALHASEMKSAFLATMSHEIRTPMNGVIGMAALLLETALDEVQREYAETVRDSAEALLGLINDILDFSKVEAGRLELEETPFDLGHEVEAVARLHAAAAAAKGVELVCAVDPALPAAVRGDPCRVRQIAGNLVGNAVKFTERGEVEVAVAARPEGERVAVEIAVSDTGIGIPAAFRDRLFDPFTQADASTTRRFGGTGLGLAICRQLAELMEGGIEVASEEGRGSCFTVRLRLRPAGEGAAPPRPDLSGVEAAVVAANGALRGALAAHLAAWGARVRQAASAAEAEGPLA